MGIFQSDKEASKGVSLALILASPTDCLGLWIRPRLSYSQLYCTLAWPGKEASYTSRDAKTYDLTLYYCVKKYSGAELMQNYVSILSKIKHCGDFALFLGYIYYCWVFFRLASKDDFTVTYRLRKKEPSLPFY